MLRRRRRGRKSMEGLVTCFREMCGRKRIVERLSIWLWNGWEGLIFWLIMPQLRIWFMILRIWMSMPYPFSSQLSSLDKLTLSHRDQWEQTFNTNIHPYFYLAKYTLPHLKAGSTIINCSSVNPYIGRPDLLDYTSTKGAIVAFTRALSNQQVSKGIRVNAVCPGPSISLFPSPQLLCV